MDVKVIYEAEDVNCLRRLLMRRAGAYCILGTVASAHNCSSAGPIKLSELSRITANEVRAHGNRSFEWTINSYLPVAAYGIYRFIPCSGQN